MKRFVYSRFFNRSGFFPFDDRFYERRFPPVCWIIADMPIEYDGRNGSPVSIRRVHCQHKQSMIKGKTNPRKRSRWLLPQLVVITAVSLGVSAYVWGFWGRIDASRFRLMVMCLPPFQKETVADALNEYYRGGIIRSTKGALFKCQPKTDDILEQFDWFTRGPIGSKVTFHASDYHDGVVKVVKAADVPDGYDFDQLPTWMNEALLWHHCRTWRQAKHTKKDRLALAMSVVSLTVRFTGAVHPVVGAFVSGAGMINSLRSDPVKAAPGVIMFLKIRATNALVTGAALWISQALALFIWKRRRRA